MPRNPPIRAVAFDLDGLIFDTEALFARVAREMVEGRGRPFDPAIIRAMIGRRAVEATDAFKALSGLDGTAQDLMVELKGRFFAELDTAVHPTPGLFVLIDRLEMLKIPRCVATSSKREYASGLLKRHGLIDRFDFLLTSEDVSHGKPDPEIYLKAAAGLKVEPANLLVLEDSPAGIEAGKRAGAYAVGVPHEHSPESGLGAADQVVSRLDDPALLALLTPLNDQESRR